LDRFKEASWWRQVQFNPDYKPPIFHFENMRSPDASLPFICGVVWYRRSIDVPADWRGRTVTLLVGSAMMDSYVFVNGRFVQRHFGHTTPFEIDLTDHLQPGAACELTIAVSNLDRSVGDFGIWGYHGYSGGLFRNVYLAVAGEGRIRDVFVHLNADLGTAQWWADVELQAAAVGQPTELHWQLRNLDGQNLREGIVPVAPLNAGGGQHVQWTMTVDELKLWSCWEPNLYEADLTWQRGGAVLDRRRQRIGLRRLQRDGVSLRLNGRPIMMRGATDLYHYPQTVTAPIDVVEYRRRFRLLQETGYNWVRFHTWVPPTECLQAADEVGMLLQVGLPRGMTVEHWKEIVRWCRLHPSVVNYCGGNEHVCDEESIPFFEKLYETAHEMDPGCTVMPQEGMQGIEYFSRMLKQYDAMPLTRKPFPHHAERLARITQCADVLGQFSWERLSYQSLRGNWRELEEKYAVYQRPVLVHEIGLNGCYLNFDLESRYTGRVPGDVYRMARENLEAAGRLHMAQRYYQNSARWHWLVLKRNFESLRKCDRAKGFDHVAPWDIHWHRTGYSCGIFNEFMELKHGYSPQKVRQSNGESVILIDDDWQHSFWVGSVFEIAVIASLYGGRDLSDGRLQWKLSAGNDVLATGELTGLSSPDGAVTTIGRLKFDWPAVTKAAKVVLSLELTGSGYQLHNQWDYWVFPQSPAPPITADTDDAARQLLSARYSDLQTTGAPLRIVSALTQTDAGHLARGGDVLLLGCDPFPSRPTSFQIGVGGRAGYDLATVVNDHPIFDALPHEGFCDWQFQSLMREGEGYSFNFYRDWCFSDAQRQGSVRCILFNDLPVDFDPIVEMVSSYKNIRLQALLWQVQTEGGRLFVCSCHIDLQDPATVVLMDSIMRYVTGDTFRPTVKTTTRELIEPLLDGVNRRQVIVETDKAAYYKASSM